MAEQIVLGSKVKDNISGFVGIATARCEYLHGLPRVEVTASVSDENKFEGERWFDESRLSAVQD